MAELLTLASSTSAAVSLAHRVAAEVLEGQLAMPAEALEKQKTEMERALEAVDIVMAILEQARQLMDGQSVKAARQGNLIKCRALRRQLSISQLISRKRFIKRCIG